MDDNRASPLGKEGTPRLFCLKGLSPWEKDIVVKYPLVYLEVDADALKWYHSDRRRALAWMKKRRGGEVENQEKAGPVDDNAPPGEDYCNLRYGFEFDQGWARLAEELGETASELVTHLRATVQPGAYIHACIFKEKFGGLRWQGNDNLIEPFSTLFRGFVNSMENRSVYICETTGARGELRNLNGWMKTLCDEEYIKECTRLGIETESSGTQPV